MSYWSEEAENRGINFEDFLEQSPLQCNLKIEASDGSGDELVALTPANMVFPFMVFVFTCVLAIFVRVSPSLMRCLTPHHKHKKSYKDPTDHTGFFLDDSSDPPEASELASVAVVENELKNTIERQKALVEQMKALSEVGDSKSWTPDQLAVVSSLVEFHGNLVEKNSKESSEEIVDDSKAFQPTKVDI